MSTSDAGGGQSSLSRDGTSLTNLFAPIRAPQLRSISRDAIQTFLAHRDQYEEAVRVQPGLSPVSWAGCIEARFLRSLIRARVFGSELTETSELTDGVVSTTLRELSKGTQPVSSDDALAAVKRHCRLDASEPDPRLRILMLMTSYMDLCESRNWNFVENAQKAAVKHLVEVLQPPALKNAVEDALKLEMHALKSDFFGFCEYLKEEAANCEKFQPLRKGSGSHHRTTTEKAKLHPKHTKPSSSSEKTKAKSAKVLPDCLNQRCDGKHFVKDCPDTSEEEKKVLLEARRAKGNRKDKKKVDFKIGALLTNTALTAPNEAPHAVETQAPTNTFILDIEGHKFACRLDSGADDVAISDTIVQYLSGKSVFLPTMHIPATNFKAVDGAPLSTSAKVQISPILHTIAGNCRLRNVTAYVIPCSDQHVPQGADCPGELILGDPFLKRSGLNVGDFVTHRLEQLSQIDYASLPHTTDTQTTLGSLGARVLDPAPPVSSDALSEPEDDLPTPSLMSGAALGALNSTEIQLLHANGDLPRYDGDDIDYRDVTTGAQCEEYLSNAIEAMITKSLVHIPEALQSHFRKLVLSFRDIFRTHLGTDSAVDVPPLRIEFEGTEKPAKVRQRTYSPAQTAFLKAKCEDLEKLGLAYRNPSSKWACAPLVVPKPGPDAFRFTVDLRPVNAQTKRNAWPMPHTDATLANLSGANYFASFDLVNAYWQMPLHPDSQECQSFHTPFGVFTPTRVLHGATNAVSYFQSTMESLFQHLDLLIWLDDILAYAKDLPILFDVLRQFFTICRTRGLKLHPLKCALVCISSVWCGRIIDRNGYRFNPRNYAALTSMAAPTTIGALIELVHGANWLRSAIPRFAELSHPLHDLLEQQYTIFKSRKKSKMANRPLSSWNDSHQTAFKHLIQAIVHQTTLATPDSSKRLCLFTDASSTHWAGVLTQVPLEQVNTAQKLPSDWDHSPVAFVSGSFKGASSRWSTPEQESYAVVCSVTRLSHILATCGQFSLFTDHKNLLYMFSPTRYNANVARHIVHKTQRWAIRMSEFDFVIEHVAGEHNTWADMLTRWAAPGNESFPARRLSVLRVPLLTQELPEMPSLQVIETSQKLKPPTSDSGFTLTDGAFRNSSGKLYVPPCDEQLQLRICVAAHCGLGGHRGEEATLSIIRDKVTWPTMEADVHAFVKTCLVCLISSSGTKVPRPLGHQQHAENVGELIHFDFLFIGESRDGYEYIMIIKDDFSGYCHLTASRCATAEAAADALLSYFSTFTPVLKWFSDQGQHFCNKVMERLSQLMGAKHNFSTAYVPWSNGTVESVCKQVLRILRALRSELSVAEANWPVLVNPIQSVINNSPSRRLGGRAPITVHTGMPSGNPLSVALAAAKLRNVSSIDEARVLQALQMDKLFAALDVIHKDVTVTQTIARTEAVKRHNAKTHVREFKPVVGDYVVVARTLGPRTKMSTSWIGPRLIAAIKNDYILVIEHLLTNDQSEVHVSRVKPYADSLVGSKVKMTEIAEQTDIIWHSVSHIRDVRKKDGKFELNVSWKGLTRAGDSWEPLSVMAEDIPAKVRNFFDNRRATAVVRQARASIGI